MNSLSPAVISVSPTTLSPVLKSELTFTLQDYLNDMAVGDFEVLMTMETDPSFARLLNVVSVDNNSPKKLTV